MAKQMYEKIDDTLMTRKAPMKPIPKQAAGEPRIGTKGPVKTGGTGGGLSKPAVAEAMKAKPAVKSTGSARDLLPKAQDTKRNKKAMDSM